MFWKLSETPVQVRAHWTDIPLAGVCLTLCLLSTSKETKAKGSFSSLERWLLHLQPPSSLRISGPGLDLPFPCLLPLPSPNDRSQEWGGSLFSFLTAGMLQILFRSYPVLRKRGILSSGPQEGLLSSHQWQERHDQSTLKGCGCWWWWW